MIVVKSEVDRALTLLRNKIREQGFTQLEVQEALAWGRSYISQLLTKQKALRLEQILLILNVIGIEPTEFFGELYGNPRRGRLGAGPEEIDQTSRGFREIDSVLRSLVQILVDRRLVDRDELNAAVASIQ